MGSRRAFLKSIVPVTAVAIMANNSVASDTTDICDDLAKQLSIAMEKRHGGRWVVAIDHDNPSIFGRRFTQASSS